MKPGKTIELNKDTSRPLRDQKFYDHAYAVDLGTRTLKGVKACQPEDPYLPEILLPGETED